MSQLLSIPMVVMFAAALTGCMAGAAAPPAPPPAPVEAMVDPREGPPPDEVLEEGLLDIDSLLAAAEPSLPPLPTAAERAAGLAALANGLRLAEEGDPLAALEQFGEGAALLPAFADWAALLAARVVAEAGDVAAVGDRLESIEGSASAWGWRVLHSAELARGDRLAAALVAEGAAAQLELPAERAVAWWWAGRARSAAGDATGALEAYRRAMREGAATLGALEAARAAHDAPGLTPDDRLWIGRTLLAHGGFERGVPMLTAFATSAGVDAGARAAAYLEAGRALFNARRYDEAVGPLRAAATVEAEAAFLLARSLYRAGRESEGIDTFLDVTRRFPATAEAAEAFFLLGDLAHDGRRDAAAEYYRQAIATGAHTVAAADAAIRLAGMRLIAGDAPGADALLTEYLTARPQDRISAPLIYWQGRAKLAMGDEAAAESRFREVLRLDPLSYYGVLAARRVEQSLTAMALPPPPESPESVAARAELELLRVSLLEELGLDEESQLELARLQVTFADAPAVLYSVAETMSEHGQPVAGALLGRSIQQTTGRWDDRLLRIVHQFPYRDLVIAEAQRHSIDPYVVAGLIRQESFFNAGAVSPVGAIGLMQVMPETASGLARRAGVSGFRSSMLTDPATNVRLGMLFLADQMDRWEGRLSDVFSAYNAGPTRVARWRQYPEHADDEIYVERIPIAETRDYVKRLTLYTEVYRRLYGPGR